MKIACFVGAIASLLGLGRGCGEWLRTSSTAFPKNPYDDPLPVNSSIAQKRFYCGVQGAAGNLVYTTEGWLCVYATQVDRSGSYAAVGAFSTLEYRYLNDPVLKLSTASDPFPTSVIRWTNGTTFDTGICAATLDGELTAGQLFTSYGRTQCLVTMTYSLGIVTTPYNPGSYYVLEGTMCGISGTGAS